MSWIDWSIVIGFVLGLLGVARWLSTTSRSVTDFMAAGRTAGRYLLATANDMGGFSAIFVVAIF